MKWNTTEWNGGIQIANLVTKGFAFTLVPGAHINAVQTERDSLKLNSLITINYKIKVVSGNPQFYSLDPSQGLKPNFRPMLQVEDDDYVGEDNRWWPSGLACGFLKPTPPGETAQLQIKLSPSGWANVWGKSAAKRVGAFRTVVSNKGRLNIVFGGGNSFSHGVAVKGGWVRFILQNWSIK